ncbi:hypothetical protein TNCV_3340681 [Trichonephila clavipes]|nr:hypothetical protein TNCV_3340681 [Trichonephila clavipes]
MLTLLTPVSPVHCDVDFVVTVIITERVLEILSGPITLDFYKKTKLKKEPQVACEVSAAATPVLTLSAF